MLDPGVRHPVGRWRRERGEGFSIKLNALPIGTEWGGVLKLLPPFNEEDGAPDDNGA